MDESAAIDAIADSLGLPSDSYEPSNSNQATEQPSPTEGDQGQTDTSESFTNIDPNTLPPELQAIYKGMQADYTRKTQEVASWRSLSKYGVDPADALQSVQFIQELNTNPEFQRSVFDQLQQALQASGMTPGQAAVAAGQAVTEAANQSDPFGEDEYGIPPQVKQQLDELNQFKQNYEQERQLQKLEQQIAAQELAIRQANPDYKDQDMQAIMKLGFAYGGNLFAAEQEYKGWRDSLLSNYIDRKASASDTPGVPNATSNSEIPVRYETLEDAHKAAVEKLYAEING